MLKPKSNKIVYIFDESFHSQFFTVTNSILQNEKEDLSDSIEFYITYFGKHECITNLLKDIKLKFPKNRFYLKHVPSSFPNLWKKYEKFYDYEKSANHIQTSSVLCRFDLDIIWPNINDKILYLDLDLIVKGSITELFNEINFECCANSNDLIYACRSEDILASEIRNVPFDKAKPNNFYLSDFRHNVEYIYYRYIRKTLFNEKLVKEILEKEYNFVKKGFNAGVFILDLEKIRKDTKLKNRINFLMELNKDGSLFRHNDQSILNVAFHDKVCFIDSAWNCLDYGWQNTKNSHQSKSKLLEGKIIHYNGPQKPWLFSRFAPVPNHFLESTKLWRKYKI
jgi:lipopolysaccharide biosynthesis glycosyltransferase